MADSEEDEQLILFHKESLDKILSWATEKRSKGSSLSKEDRQKLNNRISAQNHRVKQKKEEEKLLQTLRLLHKTMYAYIKALIDSDYEEEKTAITQAIGTKDIIECDEVDTEELGFKSPVTWGKMDYFSFIVKEFVRM